MRKIAFLLLVLLLSVTPLAASSQSSGGLYSYNAVELSDIALTPVTGIIDILCADRSSWILGYAPGAGDGWQVTAQSPEFYLTYLAHKGYGNLEIYLDGVLINSISQTSLQGDCLQNFQTVRIDAGSGKHTLRLVNSGDAPVNLRDLSFLLDPPHQVFMPILAQ